MEGECIAYTESGTICGQSPVMLDEERGGPVCLVHAPILDRIKAFHEAGHQVINYAVGRQVGPVSIKRDEIAEGWARSSWPVEVWDYLRGVIGSEIVDGVQAGDAAAKAASISILTSIQRDDFARYREIISRIAPHLFKAAIATVAGPAAQQRVVDDPQWQLWGCGSDFDQAEEMAILTTLTPSQADRVREMLLTSANEKLDQQWRSVEALAVDLLNPRYLEADKVLEIITGAFVGVPMEAWSGS